MRRWQVFHGDERLGGLKGTRKLVDLGLKVVKNE